MSVFKSPQHGNHYICQISVYKELHQFFPSPWGERVDLLCHNNQLFLERGVRPANFEWWMWLLLKNVSPNADWKLLLQIKGGGGHREDAQGDLEHVEYRRGCLARVIYLGVMSAATQSWRTISHLHWQGYWERVSICPGGSQHCMNYPKLKFYCKYLLSRGDNVH